jgi:tryptophan synthase alpha chain
MNKINQQLEKIKQEKRLGIMTHIVVGYPSLQESINLVKAMAEIGIDFVELQIPFSDPMADGPTIMNANREALRNGVRSADAMEIMTKLAKEFDIPLLFMTYYNIVFNYGTKQFCEDASKSGASGLVIPDIPVDEESHDHFIQYATDNSLIPVKLLSPVSTEERIKQNAEGADGFLYFIGRKGTTGARATLDEELQYHLKRVRQRIQVPIAVGFGVSKPEHIQTLINVNADIAVVGSAVINTYNDSPEGEGIKRVKEYLQTLIDAAKK